MIRPGSIGWFALHETRLAWRDWLSLMSAGRRRRTSTVVASFIVFAVFAHGLAVLVLPSSTPLSSMANSTSCFS